MIDRRKFMGTTLAAGSALWLWPFGISAEETIQRSSGYFHLPSTLIKSPKTQLPSGKRSPFGWETFVVPAAGKSGKTTLQFAKTEMTFTEMRLRITAVMDIREEIRIDVISVASRLLIGNFDIRYPHILQPFEILIDPSHHADVLRKGVALRMVKGSGPAWFLSSKEPGSDTYNALRAHLLLSTTKGGREQYHSMLGSFNSVQQFGWMEGCVLDGLYDLFRSTGRHEFLTALSAHLDLFFDKEKKLDYEDPRSNILKDSLYGIESALPVAIITKLEPRHPVVNRLVEFCKENVSDDALIADEMVTTEGCYTLAYPLAEVAVAKSDPELAGLAVKQLLLRHQYLFRDGQIHQRSTRSGETGYPGWARGVAWYLLGMAKTLVSLAKNEGFRELDGMETVRTNFEEAVTWALRHQQPNGLWFNYLKEGITGTDTSGSAGMAAAMALGEKHGLLTFTVRENAQRTFNQLLTMLTPDGYLTGASQSNKGGEELQRSGYRVISPYTLGLMAQLEAAF